AGAPRRRELRLVAVLQHVCFLGAGSRFDCERGALPIGAVIMQMFDPGTKARPSGRTIQMSEISGKVVLLSGASGGIGRELVRAFLEAGAAEIIAASRKPLDQIEPRVRAHALD